MCILFGIIAEARRGALSGMIRFLNASPAFMKTEILWAVVFPAFLRTYVMTNAVGLLLKHYFEPLDMPDSEQLGLRFMRV